MIARPAPHSALERRTAAALAVGVFVLLLFTQDAVGIPRDEGWYFDAGQRYAAWLDDLVERPAKAFTDAVLVQRFEFNHEHPALPKLLFGLSHRLFTETLGWTGHRLGFRLPALAFSALLAAFTFLLGARLERPAAGLFAALATVALPRHFFHLHLAAFDVPVTAAWVLTVYLYRRSLEAGAHRGWAWSAGAAFGLAVALKHNAYFLPPLLVLHWLLAGGAAALLRPGTFRERLARIPLAFPAMALLGPLFVYVSWPYLWHHPVERFGWYLNFHARHVHYSWHYLGEVLRRPPFPVAYPLVVTALTVTVPVLVLMTAGLLRAVVRLLRAGRDGIDTHRSDRLLLLLNGLFPIVLIALPAVPIFGGVKHWMPAMPFLAVLGGGVLADAVDTLLGPGRPARAVTAAAIATAVLPAAVWAGHFHPYGTSAYNALAGGAPGAAALGMQRQYWSNAVTGVLPWIDAHAPRGARIFFHEVTYSAFRWYQREGLLRGDLRFARSVVDSDLAAYQYHQEFRDQEFEIWTQYGTRRPVEGVYLDEVPLILVYARPELDLER